MGHLTTISSSSKLSRVGRNGEPDKKAGSEPKNLAGQPQNERLVARFRKFFHPARIPVCCHLRRPIGTEQFDDVASKKTSPRCTIPGKKNDEHTGRGTAQRYAMIKELSVQFPVKECCVALRVSRSGYYQWVGTEQSLRAETNAELWKEIQRVYDQHKGRYGSPRITQQLRQEGLGCGKNRVARLMRKNQLAARGKKAFRPRTTTPGQGAAPNLIKELEPSAPDQVWASDITYVATLEGWLYLAVILDLFRERRPSM